MTRLTMRPVAIAADSDRSYWLQDVDARAASAPLSGSSQCDVAIIGGGYCGLWTALRLKEQAPELRVTILEADICGGGASGRNGGQVHSWFAEIDQLTRVVGAEEALRLCRATADAIEELAALHSSGTIEMDLRLDGWLWTASSAAQEGAWNPAVAATAKRGEAPLRPLDAGAIRRRSGTDSSYVGVEEVRAGSVHPAKLALGLRALAQSRGVVVHEATPVHHIEAGKLCRLITPDGTLSAGKVVIATNAWAASIPELRRYMYVVDSQIIATAPVPEKLEALGWTSGASICDAQAHVLYWQRTPGGRVIFGRGSGNVAFSGAFGPDFNRRTGQTHDNLRELHRVYPTLRDVAITHDWTGPIDCMAEHLPVFGHLSGQPDILFGVGFNGTGIAQTPVAGRILASLVLGHDDEWSRSGLVGLARRTALPPEPIRYLGARVVRHAIRLRNDAEIENRRPATWVRVLSSLAPGH
ncbi:NAD(P)/FAD-dependent oxidoreductase [Pseudotabrizicola alkalilacus]|uniref:FAD-dependent oxidoreductase n=1 Tax=Pseudotabrizicola alkalilacus TaxID=2305252 RepID=A0A411YWV6_9RHOB|nr:FAD-binding oxidoreductase [Pseudotabrizicola alkalilacus]RGP35260.1 FAD-dependent oxidoreductase [Pseudotabrizicola alkalilacus]